MFTDTPINIISHTSSSTHTHFLETLSWQILLTVSAADGLNAKDRLGASEAEVISTHAFVYCCPVQQKHWQALFHLKGE